MKVDSFSIGVFGTNCYIVQNNELKEGVIVDPGGRSTKVVNYIKDQGIEIKAILLTHGHFDHIMGLDDFTAAFPVPVYVHENEKELIADPSQNCSTMVCKGYTFTDVEYVKDHQILDLAGYQIEVIYTPGHTIGGCCYYIKDENVLFAGDTLFHESVGRTDFPTGSAATLVQSIKERLMCLPDETVVYPGHMGETTIGHERSHNPFLY